MANKLEFGGLIDSLPTLLKFINLEEYVIRPTMERVTFNLRDSCIVPPNGPGNVKDVDAPYVFGGC
jgi:hypothetical protein